VNLFILIENRMRNESKTMSKAEIGTSTDGGHLLWALAVGGVGCARMRVSAHARGSSESKALVGRTDRLLKFALRYSGRNGSDVMTGGDVTS
jgi:hypothetical protein